MVKEAILTNYGKTKENNRRRDKSDNRGLF